MAAAGGEQKTKETPVFVCHEADIIYQLPQWLLVFCKIDVKSQLQANGKQMLPQTQQLVHKACKAGLLVAVRGLQCPQEAGHPHSERERNGHCMQQFAKKKLKSYQVLSCLVTGPWWLEATVKHEGNITKCGGR